MAKPRMTSLLLLAAFTVTGTIRSEDLRPVQHRTHEFLAQLVSCWRSLG